MSIEGNTPGEIAEYIKKNVFSDCSSDVDELHVLANAENVLYDWRDQLHSVRYNIPIGRDILKSWVDGGLDLTLGGRREVDYHMVSVVLDRRFGLNICAREDIDKVLDALVDLFVI